MYNKKFLEIVNSLDGKKKLLLHSCCAPCSSYCIDYLKNYFDVTVIFYNPNIEPLEEYEKRKSEQIKLCKRLNVNIIDIDYENEVFKDKTRGLEHFKEGEARCFVCFKIRLKRTLEYASDFDYFTTTLTVSPRKNSKVINEIGINLSDKYLVSDFKKNDGYKKSIAKSNEYGLYRQHYCGCLYAREER